MYDTKHKYPQIYIKLTSFKDNDCKKLPCKLYLLRCCSFWEISKTSSRKWHFCMYTTFLKTVLCEIHFFFLEKKLTINEAETSTGKLYYIHPHSPWVGDNGMAKNMTSERYQNPLKELQNSITLVYCFIFSPYSCTWASCSQAWGVSNPRRCWLWVWYLYSRMRWR